METEAYVFGQCDPGKSELWTEEGEPPQVCACACRGDSPREPEEPFEMYFRSVCPQGMRGGNVFARWPLSPSGEEWLLGIKVVALRGRMLQYPVGSPRPLPQTLVLVLRWCCLPGHTCSRLEGRRGFNLWAGGL